MANQKIEIEIKKIGNLKERILRLIGLREKKIAEIRKEHNYKVNKIYTLIELAREKIQKEKIKSLKEKEVPEDIRNDLGINWINGKTTETVPVHFEKIPDVEDFLDDELLLE